MLRFLSNSGRRDLRSRVVPFAIGIVLSSGLALAQAPAEKPKPGPEHKRLGHFVGKWTADVEIKPNAFMPGGKATSQDTCEWFDNSPMVMASVPRGTVQGGTWVYDDETKREIHQDVLEGASRITIGGES
jgi:hypothetical protein